MGLEVHSEDIAICKLRYSPHYTTMAILDYGSMHAYIAEILQLYCTVQVGCHWAIGKS